MEGDAASLFFQLVTCRYEQGSMITTSNLTFSKWASVSLTPRSPPRS
ncbi:hypothetical protein DC090_04515 [Trueperella pyogenes]|nr:hypothetical protein DC090_04515 [Trueperella pyogenes]AWG16474.1 hypothetical protein DDE06_06445 [Trueperella pyogenes]